jgi:hypothetical protein
MLPTDALKQLAYYAGTITGLNADYPATNRIKAPHLMVWFNEAEIISPGEQLWRMTAKGQLLGSVKGGDIKTDFINVEQFFAPLADLFSPQNHAAYHLLDSVTGAMVDFCQLSRIASGQAINWLGSDYYGAELFFDIKLRRFAGDS